MKTLIVVLACVLSGCALTPEQNLALKRGAYGYRPYDPCIRCGERWQQLPNWDNEAIVRRARGEQW
jgi:hypothetical protein